MVDSTDVQHPDNLYFFPCLCYDGVVATVENGGITKIKGGQNHPGAKEYFLNQNPEGVEDILSLQAFQAGLG